MASHQGQEQTTSALADGDAALRVPHASSPQQRASASKARATSEGTVPSPSPSQRELASHDREPSRPTQQQPTLPTPRSCGSRACPGGHASSRREQRPAVANRTTRDGCTVSRIVYRLFVSGAPRVAAAGDVRALPRKGNTAPPRTQAQARARGGHFACIDGSLSRCWLVDAPHRCTAPSEQRQRGARAALAPARYTWPQE